MTAGLPALEPEAPGSLKRARSCDGKARFRTIGKAERARERALRRGTAGTGLRVYRCRFGKHYHLGHGPWPGLPVQRDIESADGAEPPAEESGGDSNDE